MTAPLQPVAQSGILIQTQPKRRRKGRKSMNRRKGQNGTVVIQSGWYRVRWRMDVEGKMTAGIAPQPEVVPFPKAKTRVRAKRESIAHLTPDQVLAILKAARTRSIRDWAMLLLAYRHGLRASEVCDLKLADVDLKAGSVSIRRLKGSLHTVQPLYPHKGQPLLDEVGALRAWLRER